jgi:hydrogenase maturation protein HypF
MALEFALGDNPPGVCHGIPLARDAHNESGSLILDWRPMIHELLAVIERGSPVSMAAAVFHNSLVESIVDVAQRIGENCVVLTGGCFQNRYLTERTINRLRQEGFNPHWHRNIPPNDGGLALGQAFWTARMAERNLL